MLGNEDSYKCFKVTSAKRAEDEEALKAKKEMVRIVDNSKTQRDPFVATEVIKDENLVAISQVPAIREMVKIVDNSKSYDTVRNRSEDSQARQSQKLQQDTILKEMVRYVDNRSTREIDRNEKGETTLKKELVPQTNRNLKEMVKIVDKKQNNEALQINMDVFKIAGIVNEAEMINTHNISLLAIPNTNASMAIVQVIEGENARYKCLVSVNNGIPREVEVPISKFNDGKWLRQIPCLGIIGGSKAAIVISEYLNRYVMNYTGVVAREIKKPGWTSWEGKLFYVTPTGVISKYNAPIYSMYGQTFPPIYGGENLGAIKEFLEQGNLTPRSPVAVIIYLYTIVSFLHSFYKSAGIPVKFSLFLHGKRGCMKTSLSLAMTQIEDRKVPEYSLRSTSAGLEAGFRRYKDAVMLIDDLCPTNDASEQRALQHNLELMVRCFGDGTGKKRNSDYTTTPNVMQYEAEGGAIITGEYIAGVESSLSRSLFLPLHDGDINVELLSKIQEEDRLAKFMRGFISYIEDNSKACITYIAHRCKEYRATKKGVYSNSRYGEYYADLMTASDLLLQFGHESGQLREDEVHHYHRLHQMAVEHIIDSNNTLLKEEAPIAHMCNSIIEGIESGDYAVIEFGTGSDFPGKVILNDSSCYYIPQPILKQMKETHDKMHGLESTILTSSSKYISKLLSEHGVIEVLQEGKQRRYSKKFAGYGNVRYVVVKKEKLTSFVTL